MLLLSPATEKQSKLSKKRERRSGKGREDQEGTGPAELSSFSGPATKSRTRESVWTSQLTEPFKPILEPRLGLPALRGATLSSLVPRVRREELRVFKHSRGGGITSNAKALRHPQLESKQISLGNQGFCLFPGIGVEGGSCQVLRGGPIPPLLALGVPRNSKQLWTCVEVG